MGAVKPGVDFACRLQSRYIRKLFSYLKEYRRLATADSADRRRPAVKNTEPLDSASHDITNDSWHSEGYSMTIVPAV
jgi:hypothetical protein